MSDTVLPSHFLKNFSDTDLLKLPSNTFKATKAYLSLEDIKKIQNAYTFAFYAHKGQKRKDGSDYIGGNYATSINMSATLPQVLPSFQNTDISLFLDAAHVWGVDYSSVIDDSNKIRSSTGLLLDIVTPVGPMNFSWALPITRLKGDRTETFRFNIGTTF